MKLSDDEKTAIRELTRRVEERTGAQVLSVVAGRSDSYPEAAWKAFSLGAVLGMLVPARAVSLPLAAAAAAGLLFALAVFFIPPFARLCVSGDRAGEETRQFANSLFLERGLHRTPSRKAILVLFSQFERRAAITADSAAAAVPAAELDGLAALMARKTAAEAFAAGLPALEQLLLRHGFAAAGAPDEVPEEFLESEGPQP